MKENLWLSRSLPMLALGLVVLALGLFIAWPAGWSWFLGILGAAILVAWALGFPRGHAAERRRMVERRQAQGERRQQRIEVAAERRYNEGERRAS